MFVIVYVCILGLLVCFGSWWLRSFGFACLMVVWLIVVLGGISCLLVNSVDTVGLFILVVSVGLFCLIWLSCCY